MSFQTPHKRREETIKIVAIYALVGIAWIYGSDTAVGWLVHDKTVMVNIAVAKGSLFILGTATLLYVLITRFVEQLVAAECSRMESLKNYQTIFNATSEAIIIHDAHTGKILDVNDRMLEMYGYNRDEALAIEIGCLSEGMSPYSQKEGLENVRRALSEGPQIFEWHSRRKSGELFWSEVSLKKVLTNDHDRIIAVVRDISERKEAEEIISNSNKLIQTVINTAPMSIFLKDRELRYIGCNNAFARDAGVKKPEEVIGKDDNQLVWKNQAECYRADDLRIIASGVPKLSYDEPQTTPEGRQIWLRTSKVPLRNEANEIIGVLGMYEDITDRKKAEEENKKLQAQLNQAQKIESVGRLAGGVAHDFNNMLAVIIGHAEMALEEVDPASPLAADLHDIQNAAERSADLTRQLLAFARKQAVAPKVINLNVIIEGMLQMLRRLIGENIQLVWEPEADLWPVKMDPAQIDQILAQLCVNARDAVTGKGTVSIATDNVPFNKADRNDPGGLIPGDFVLLTFRDDGCGIDKESQAKLFEPFFTTKEMGKGTGLGLATVYGIVKQNNGFIYVKSEKGCGTAFTIYLPRHQPQAEQVSEDGPGAPAELGRETILLVEDELTILEMVRKMLERLGYTVVAANSPGEALEIAENLGGKIDLLITDVIMPEMDGQELVENLLPLCPRLKRLFMSGYTADVITRHGVLDRAVNFIQKPFSKRELAGKVSEVLGQS